MELRDLRAFVILAETLHFSQAAARQHVSQSALSKQIKRLEQEFGGPLFIRTAAGTSLTELGRDLQQDASRMIEQSNRLVRRAHDIVAGVDGSLRIGFGVATKHLVPAAISAFRQQKPRVAIELRDLSTHHQIMALHEGTLDVGFCRLPAPAGWPSLAVIEARFLAVLPASYPHGITLKQLGQKPLVVIQRAEAPSFYDHMMNYLTQSGLALHDVQYVSDFAAAAALAAAGVAWGIVPSSSAIEHHHVRTMELQGPGASWTIGLTRSPRADSRLVQDFWHIVQQMQGNNSNDISNRYASEETTAENRKQPD
jgi:DNA-binding transcriptional LysR family regulator